MGLAAGGHSAPSGRSARPKFPLGAGADGSRTLPYRSGGYVRLCRSAAGAGARCSDARCLPFDRQPEGQRELVAVVGLHLADREGAGGLDFPKERDAVAVVELAVEAQDAVVRAIVQRRVLEEPLPPARTNFAST